MSGSFTRHDRFNPRPGAGMPFAPAPTESTRDVTNHRARLEALLEISRELSRIQPLESLLGKMAEACGQLLDSDSVGIRVRDGDDLVLAGAYGASADAMSTPRLKMGESLSGVVAVSGEPLVVWNPADDPRLTPAHREAYRRYRAFLGVPLTVGAQVLGVLSIRTRREYGFSLEDLHIVGAFAAQAAIALENARLYRQTEERAEKLETFSALTGLMTSAGNSPRVIEAVAQAATTLLGAAMARVWVADPLGRVLRDQGSSRVGPELEQLATELRVIRYGEGLIGPIVESRVPEYIFDIGQDCRLLNPRLTTEAGLRGFAGLPLIAGDLLVGVLAIFFRGERRFTAEDKELMRLLANQAAISIHNARLLEESKHHQARLEALLSASRELSGIQPVVSLLKRIAEACGRLLGSESVGFRLMEGDELIVSGSWGDNDEIMLAPRLKIGESLSGMVAARGEPLAITDLANDARLLPAHREANRRLGYRGMLVIPVKVGERVVGVLSIRTRREEGFSAEDLTIATAFASQAAVALENSRLYQETQRAYDELSETQDQLTQARKMEAVGRLAGGIAHDFNNLLTVMTGRSQLLLRRLTTEDPVRAEIELIEKTANRAADLTRQLLAFSRKQILQPTVMNLNAAVATMSEMLRRMIGEDVLLVTALDPSLGWVQADPSQIEQIVINLAVNARDAMPKGGRLTLGTANVELEGAYARAHVGAHPGPHVMLAVSDTGVGMDADTRTRIFEPFFTTKGPGKGTGLGLATVYGIVKQSGGHICVYSELGQGTAFKIYLPRVDPAADPVEPGGLLAHVAQGRETILLVEDEGAVRELARDILEANGYAVLEARHGDEALAICERHSEAIHLMLTDVVMPGMNGRELAERLARLRPETKVLYMSGYTDNAIVLHGVLNGRAVFLQKPFTPDALARKVREVLSL